MGEPRNTNVPSCRFREYLNKHRPSNQPLTVFKKDAIVFGIQSSTGNIIQMTNSVKASLSSWKPVFRAEFFSVLSLLVLFIITGVAVTPGASG